ncbi:MAG: IS607 family transposase [Prevotella sp.]
MKSAKVLKILHVSRQTLVQYVKKKDIRVVKLPNGTYDYNDDDVYRKAGLAAERMNVIYSRVSTAKQKTDLDNQEKTLIDYCNKNGIKVSKSYKDIASGMNFDRKQFRQLLDEILNFKVSRLYITYKDRLSRISFDMFKRLFGEFGCEIIVINDTDDKANETEIFEEIISMLHFFAMRMYTPRRKKKLEIMEEDLKNEISL